MDFDPRLVMQKTRMKYTKMQKERRSDRDLMIRYSAKTEQLNCS